MDLGIKGRTAIVCASSRGLGKACAAALAAEGVTVVINGLNEKRLEASAEEIRELWSKVGDGVDQEGGISWG